MDRGCSTSPRASDGGDRAHQVRARAAEGRVVPPEPGDDVGERAARYPEAPADDAAQDILMLYNGV